MALTNTWQRFVITLVTFASILLHNTQGLELIMEPTSVEEGGSVTMNCKVDEDKFRLIGYQSGPFGEFFCYKGALNDPTVCDEKKTNGLIQVMPDDSIVIPSVTVSNIGDYWCDNEGKAADKVTLEVTVTPVVDLIVDSVLVQEERNIILTCSINRSNPEATITWIKDGLPLAEEFVEENTDLTSDGKTHYINSVLTYKANRTDDKKTVTCSVKWKDKEFNKETILDIGVLPETHVHNNSVPIRSQGVTLHCMVAVSNPKESQQYTWLHSGEVLEGQNQASLELQTLDFEHEGEYECITNNSLGQGSCIKPFNLRLWFPPFVQISAPDPSPVTQGSTTTILCSSNSSYPDVTKVRWTQNGRQIDLSAEKYNLTDHSLLVTVESKEDRGSYQCFLENEVGETASEIVNLEVFYPPETGRVDWQNGAIMISEEVTLNCTSSDFGYPKADSAEWFKEGISQGNHSIYENPYKIETKGIGDTGPYSCKLYNSVGSSPKVSEEYSLELQAPSEIEYPAEENIILNPTMDEIDGFTITAVVSGFHDDSFRTVWKINGEKVDSEEFEVTETKIDKEDASYNQTVAYNTTLTFKPKSSEWTCDTAVKYNGAYTVTVMNIAGGERVNRTSKDFNVEFHYASKWKGAHNFISASPGESAMLECDVCASPEPVKYQWTFIPPGGEKKELDQGGRSYNMSNVSLEDYGNYTCMAENEPGGVLVQKNFLLQFIKAGDPKSPIEFKILANVTPTAVTLQWTGGYHGGFAPQVFSLEYKPREAAGNFTLLDDDIEETNPGEPITYTVQNLVPMTIYVFKLRAINNRNFTSDHVFAIGTTDSKTAAAMLYFAAGAAGVVILAVLITVVVVACMLKKQRTIQNPEYSHSEYLKSEKNKSRMKSNSHFRDPSVNANNRKGALPIYAVPDKSKKKNKKTERGKDNFKATEGPPESAALLAKDNQKNKTPDGPTYAELNLAQPPSEEKVPLVHKKEDDTEYAQIDHSRKA